MKFNSLLLLSICMHLYMCPFSKVEESFNMQAMHDLMVYGTENIQYFDHIMFPGVVPRTFIGSIIVSIFATPLKYLCTNLIKFDNTTGVENNVLLLYLCRFIIGLLSYESFCYLRKSAAIMLYKDSKLSRDVFCSIFNMLMAISFHLPFYMSRSLPNTFALIGIMVAMGHWMQGRAMNCLYIIAAVMLIFRCDMLILLVPLTLQMIVCGEIHFWKALLSGIAFSTAALLFTVIIDSYYWKPYYNPEMSVSEEMNLNFYSGIQFVNNVSMILFSFWSSVSHTSLSMLTSLLHEPSKDVFYIWPEGMVLFFNTVENKSSEWGVMPYHWYISHALPKALHGYLILLICGLLNVHHGTHDGDGANDRALASLFYGLVVINKPSGFNLKLLYYTTPSVIFIALYSLLPHKELRFIMPVLPVFILGASVGLMQLIPCAHTLKEKSLTLVSKLYGLLLLLCVVVVSALITYIFTMASVHNYPGGNALFQFDQNVLASSQRLISVHLDPTTCMTGVTRFLQRQSPSVEYSKDESISEFGKFDYIFVGDGFIEAQRINTPADIVKTCNNEYLVTKQRLALNMSLYEGFQIHSIEYGFSHYDITGLKRGISQLLGFRSVASRRGENSICNDVKKASNDPYDGMSFTAEKRIDIFTVPYVKSLMQLVVIPRIVVLKNMRT